MPSLGRMAYGAEWRTVFARHARLFWVRQAVLVFLLYQCLLSNIAKIIWPFRHLLFLAVSLPVRRDRDHLPRAHVYCRGRRALPGRAHAHGRDLRGWYVIPHAQASIVEAEAKPRAVCALCGIVLIARPTFLFGGHGAAEDGATSAQRLMAVTCVCVSSHPPSSLTVIRRLSLLGVFGSAVACASRAHFACRER
jgi:hypothetical protein